jgi:phosphoglucosamine mutase
MKKTGCKLGGEPSGHLIFSDYTATGDGQLTAILLLEVMAEEKCTASALRKRLTPWPQLIKNIPIEKVSMSRLQQDDLMHMAIIQANSILREGKILVRPSGTEDVIRVLVSGREKTHMETAMKLLEETILEAAKK